MGETPGRSGSKCLFSPGGAAQGRWRGLCRPSGAENKGVAPVPGVSPIGIYTSPPLVELGEQGNRRKPRKQEFLAPEAAHHPVAVSLCPPVTSDLCRYQWVSPLAIDCRPSGAKERRRSVAAHGFLLSIRFAF